MRKSSLMVTESVLRHTSDLAVFHCAAVVIN